MGIYSDYLNSGIATNFEELTKERKRQLRCIAGIRGRDVLVIAADMGKQVPGLTTAISFEDRLPISDQLSNLQGNALDLILETPGGLGDVAEEIVRQIRDKYSSLAVIIPGWAQSAGTIWPWPPMRF
ncbi:MAG: SDH family Clp fold serine proteinase [Rhodospirillales bacterium]